VLIARPFASPVAVVGVASCEIAAPGAVSGAEFAEDADCAEPGSRAVAAALIASPFASRAQPSRRPAWGDPWIRRRSAE